MKLAIITGGSRGLGAALCAHYQAAGWAVLELSRSAPHPYSAQLDLAQPAQIEAQLAHALARWREVTISELIIINNAGSLSAIGPLAQLASTDISDNLTINLLGPAVLLGALLREFQPQPCRKRLVQISSGAARRALAGWSLYCAAKAGMDHLLVTLAEEQALHAHGFECLVIDPGVMDTAMQAEIRASDPTRFPEHAHFVARHASGQLRAPGLIASAIARILQHSSDLNGQRLQAADYL